MRARKVLLFLLFACAGLLWAQPAAAAPPLKVEALGFFSHPPMWETRDTIQKVCQEFGDRVQLVMHDETTADGQKFMQDHGLSGHIPMELYINGVLVVHDFVNMNWKAEDLEQAIKLALDGEKVTAPTQAGAGTETGTSSAPQGNSSDAVSCPLIQSTTTGNSSGASIGSSSVWYRLLPYGMGLIIILLLAALFLTRRRMPKEK